MTLQPGQELARYRIERKIGEGGMGVVWQALDTKLDRPVAIKVLPEKFSRHRERLERFEREAKLLASLSHQNIATLYGLEEIGGLRFLVMEFVEGETLEQRIAGSPMPVDEALPLFLQILEGLETAHEKGIVHRDLKPANIKITPDGKVKILDFGLAKAFVTQTGSLDEASQSPTLTQGTALGGIIGTSSYMSPEQARGKAVDTRADIWACGCLLYEMLTGRRAFDGETITDVLAGVIEREPDWSLLPSRMDARIQELLRRCLTKDSRLRLQHAGDGRIQVGEVLSGPPVPPDAAGTAAADQRPDPAARSRERFAWITVALLLAVIAGLVYVVIDSRSRPAAKKELRIATAGPSGVYYPIGVGIARLVERKLPDVTMEAFITEGSFENAQLLDRGETDLALIQNDIAFNAVKTELVLGYRSSRIAGLAVLYEETAQVVVAKNAGIATIHDLDDRVVSLGAPGSGQRFSSEALLSHFGVHTREPDERFWDTEEAMFGLVDGSLEAAIIWRAIPSPFLEGAFRSGKVQLLPIGRELLDGLRVNQPFLVPVTIPAHVYPNQNEPVSAISVKAMLAASTLADADLIEDILRVVFENIPDLIAHHPRASDISPNTAFRLEDGMSIDLHPGAERLFRSRSDGGGSP